MSRWFRKPEPPKTEVVEQVEPVEIPVITEVKRRLGRGDYRGAVRYAYPKAVNDLAKAFNARFPPHWTHEEFLRSLKEEEMGHLPEFLRLLYQLYAPIRYAQPGTPTLYGPVRGPEAPQPLPLSDAPAILSSLLQSIYAQRPMWQLYIEPKLPPTEGDGPTLPATPTDAPGSAPPTTPGPEGAP